MGWTILLQLAQKFLGKNGMLSAYWRELLIVVMGGFILYQNTSQVRYVFFINTIPYLENQMEVLDNNLTTCKDGNKVLSKSIDDRNEEILKWKDVTDQLKIQQQKLEEELKTKVAINQKQTRDILNSPTPKTCESAIQYLRDGRKDLTW